MSEELDTAWQSACSEGDWDERFRERWRAIARDAEHAIAGPDANVDPIYDRITALAREMGDDQGLPEETWPLYGSLLSSMRHIAVVGEVRSQLPAGFGPLLEQATAHHANAKYGGGAGRRIIRPLPGGWLRSGIW